MVFAERGATRGDRRGDAGLMHRHHVGVALDHNGLMALGNRFLRVVETEQHLGLLVQHGLWRVHVLAHVVVVEQLAGAETDDVAAEVADGPEQTAMEPVDGAALPLLREPRGLEFGELETLRQQGFGHLVPAGRRVAQAELQRDCAVERPLGEVVASSLGLRGLELLRVVLLGCRIGRHQSRPGSPVTGDAGAAPFEADLVPDPVGKLLDSLDEADVLHLLQERVDVAAFTASEAVEVTVIGPNMERRRLLVVERAQSLE